MRDEREKREEGSEIEKQTGVMARGREREREREDASRINNS